jgi:tetratricopeptide (TPR) repeat protein
MARAQTVLGVVPEWGRLLLWPASLQADYGPPQIPIGGPFEGRHALGAGILLLWGALLVLAVRRGERLIAAGLLWIPIALSPVSNLLFPTGILLAERTLFAPSIGLALIVAGLVDALPRRRTAVMGVVGLLVLLGGLRSHSRVEVWRDQQTFFDQMVVDGARSYRSWYSAGLYARLLGDTDRARQLFAESWRLEKRDYRVAEEYGQMLRAARDYEAAVIVFEEAFRLAPNEEPLTSRLLESLMALERWEDAEQLIAQVREMSEEDAARLEARLARVRP